MEQLTFVIKDFIGNLMDFEFVDIARPGFFLLWLICLCTPLRGVDRRDRMCGSVYCLFMASAGVALLIALPQRWVSQSMTLLSQMVMVIFMSVGAFIRWELGKDGFKAVETFKDAKFTEGGQSNGKGPKKESRRK